MRPAIEKKNPALADRTIELAMQRGIKPAAGKPTTATAWRCGCSGRRWRRRWGGGGCWRYFWWAGRWGIFSVRRWRIYDVAIGASGGIFAVIGACQLRPKRRGRVCRTRQRRLEDSAPCGECHIRLGVGVWWLRSRIIAATDTTGPRLRARHDMLASQRLVPLWAPLLAQFGFDAGCGAGGDGGGGFCDWRVGAAGG